MGEDLANGLGLDPAKILRRSGGVKEGRVRVKMTHLPEPIELSFRKGSRKFEVRPREPQVLLLGYGATRLLPAEVPNGLDAGLQIRIKNLFDAIAPLSDAEAWLADPKALSGAQFDRVALVLKDLLMLDSKAILNREKKRVYFQMFDDRERSALDELSAGFQSVVAMACDMMISLLTRWERIESAEAIVLLDEIEVHLHPTWKIEIVARLRKAFPRVSFLATTHDPLCLKGLHDGEIVVLRLGEDDRVVANQGLPSAENLRIDQILTSDFFGVRATSSSTVQNQIKRYSKLMGKKKRTAKEQAEFERLRVDLEPINSWSDTPAEKHVEAAIRTTLFKGRSGPTIETGAAKSPGHRREKNLKSEVEAELRRQLAELMSKTRVR